MSTLHPITLILADDHVVVRQGFRLLLEQEVDFKLVAEASDGLEAVEMVAKHCPRVLILDLMLPRLHGLEVARRVHREHPETKVVILSMHSEEPYVLEALRNGVSGYVLKDASVDELVGAIRQVLSGRRYLSPVLADLAFKGWVEHPGESAQDVYDNLTNRERVVLQLAAEGLTSPQIAEKLFISPRTAETHRANLMRKLGLSSQTDLVRFAIRKGIIDA